jgi:hypothetical protein
MFELDAAVRTWRNELARQQTLTKDDIDELEDHFRATCEELVETGIAPDQAVALTRQALGEPLELATEFRKNDDPWWRRFIRAGWVMFAVSFVLPVHAWGITVFNTTIGDGAVPGIQAFLIALQGEGGPIGVISALTNVAMLLTFWKLAGRGRPNIVIVMTLMIGAALLNGWWLFQIDHASELMIGYYTWWASFGVVASGLALRARALARHALLTA